MASRVEVNWRQFDALKAKLGAIANGLDTPAGRRFIEKAKRIIEQDNRDGLLRGLDKDGVPFAPLAASTLRSRDGGGPPLSPHESASRVIARFEAVEYRYAGQVIVAGQWVGANFLRYHRTGTRNMPRRNPVGFRPAARQRLKDAAVQFRRDLLRNGGR